MASDATFHFSNQGLPKQNVASDATFRLGNQGNQGLPKRNVASSFPAPPARFPATLVTWGLLLARGWVARTELERVLFPLEKAKAQASLEPKSQGPSTARDGAFLGGFSFGIALKPS